MSIALITARVRHERRLRLEFSNTLAAGAFTTLSWYTITSDGTAADPPVVAAYSVTSASHAVELHLGSALVQGVLYTVSAVGVPAADLSSTADPSETKFRVGVERGNNDIQATPKASDLERRLYGMDLVHDGTDWIEGPDGDLATAEGKPVVKGDILRGVVANGLPWDERYGMRARQYVDAPSPMLAQLPAIAEAYVQRDDRVESVTADVVMRGDLPVVRFRPHLIGDQLVSSIGEIEAPLQ